MRKSKTEKKKEQENDQDESDFIDSSSSSSDFDKQEERDSIVSIKQREHSEKVRQLKDMEMAKRDTEIRKRPMNVINIVGLEK